jgi:preprotein translocase subunit YajC
MNLQLLAQNSPPPDQPGALDMFAPILLMLVIGYFIIIRPQRKKQAELQKQIDSMRIGDKVVTAGGIHGLITNVKDRTAVLKVADNVKMEFEKTSISQVLKKEGAAEEASILEEGSK